MAWTQHPEGVPKPEAFSIEDLGFSFQKIKAGSFTMGSPKYERGRNRDEAQVEVTITKGFEMQTTEVTQKQYFLVTRKRPSRFSNPWDCENYDEVNEICPDYPVENVSWYDAKEFISLLNASAGVKDCKGTPEDPSGCYRLPTEAEFEWAVRGEESAKKEWPFFWGNGLSPLGKYTLHGRPLRWTEWTVDWDVVESGDAVDESSLEGTFEVTIGEPNPNNLHGVIGNVKEWTEDVYKVKLEGGKDPLNIKKEYEDGCCRVLRGGAWNDRVEYFRSASRTGLVPR